MAYISGLPQPMTPAQTEQYRIDGERKRAGLRTLAEEDAILAEADSIRERRAAEQAGRK